MNLNPLNLTAVSPTNYVQPNTANPAPNLAIANFPTGSDVLQLRYVTVPAKFAQPLSATDSPGRTIPF